MYSLSTQHQQRLDTYKKVAQERMNHFLGYPIAQDFDYSELYPLLALPLNNIGDPMVESTYDLNSRSIEREVLDFFADLFHAPPQNWWGYVTNGGSEGNLYGLYVARELYPNGIVYYSESTHYSVQKNIQLLNIQSIVIRSKANGEMDYDDLHRMVELHRDKPVIILANIGTTMTEAKDDLAQIKSKLRACAVQNYYIHCDAALAGVYSALLNLSPGFDFLHGADSLAFSGHKFIGSPLPCGVVLVKKNYKDRIGKAIPYIGTVDTTITGSRNGHSPLFLWYAINKLGRKGLAERALRSMELAEYTVKKMQQDGIPAWRNPDALTVVFPAPPESLRKKWQIATDDQHSHLICMPGVTQQQVDEFIEEWVAESVLIN